MSEPPGGHFDEELLKAHTGEDMILARDLYGKASQMAQFPPTHKIVFLTNEPPSTDDVGISMRRRARMLRFEEDFTGPRADMTIEDRVKAEKQGILVALVAMAVSWYRNGLPMSDDVDRWSEDYIRENDPIGGWIESNCVLRPSQVTSATVLYNDYQHWAAREDVLVVANSIFGMMLAKRFKKHRYNRGIRYEGIGLKSVEDRASDGEEND
jgi:putative DNA primase/helicase